MAEVITWWGTERRRGPECPLWFAAVLLLLRLAWWGWWIGTVALCLGWRPPLL